MLRSLRHYLLAQSQGHHTSLIVWRRKAWKKEALSDLPWKDERRSSSIRQTLEKTKAILGKLLRDRVECIGLFQAHQYHLELNWSKTTFPHALSILILWKWYEPHTKDWPPLSTDFHCGLSSGFPLCCCNNFYIKVLQRYWFSQTSNLCLLKHFDISVVLQTFFKQTSPHCPIVCVCVCVCVCRAFLCVYNTLCKLFWYDYALHVYRISYLG